MDKPVTAASSTPSVATCTAAAPACKTQDPTIYVVCCEDQMTLEGTFRTMAGARKCVVDQISSKESAPRWNAMSDKKFLAEIAELDCSFSIKSSTLRD